MKIQMTSRKNALVPFGELKVGEVFVSQDERAIGLKVGPRDIYWLQTTSGTPAQNVYPVRGTLVSHCYIRPASVSVDIAL